MVGGGGLAVIEGEIGSTEDERGEGVETVDDGTPAFKDEVRLDEEGTCTKGDCNATFEGVCCSR